MGIVDAYAWTEAAKTEGWWDATHRRFEQVLLDLLPNGPAWNREGVRLRSLVRAQAAELSRVDLRSAKLLAELDPATTFELLTDWEAMLGLPDCGMPPTLEARRAAIAAKLLAQTGHDQSVSYWTSLLVALGWALLWVDKGRQVTTCVDDCIDPLWTDEWEFVWQLVVEVASKTPDQALLECVTGHQALIETLALVHYAWHLADPPVGSETIRGIATTMKGYTAVIGTAGLILRAGDDLETWIAETPPIVDDFFCICHGSDEGLRLIAAGMPGTIIYSDDGGDNWGASAAAAVVTQVYGISRGPMNDAVVVAAGAAGSTYRSTDGGLNWTAIGSPVVTALRAVTRSTLTLIAVGDNRSVIRSTSNGASWSNVSPGGGTENLLGVSAWGTTVIAVGSSGVILRSTDGGASWAASSSPTTVTLRAVTSSPTGRWTACGADGVILQSLDDGKTWKQRTSPTTEDLYAAGIDWPSGQAIVAGANRTIVLE